MSNHEEEKSSLYFGLVRIALGLIFLWAFFDKLLGLGFATSSDKAWLAGSSPTAGFLGHAVRGPLTNFYHSLVGNPFIDWLFMLGLLGIGLALTLGVGMKIAGYMGALLMFLMWLALLPPENHPFIDDHIVYLLVLLGLAHSKAGSYLGLGEWWSKTDVVKQYPILQ